MSPTEEAVMEKPSQEPSKEKLPSPQERLELVMLGLAREQTVDRLCQQAGVSKSLFYQWLRRGKEALLKALAAKKPGRKPILPPESAHAVSMLEARIKHMEQEISDLRQDRDRFKTLSEVGQRIIQRNGWNPEPQPAKKNGRRTRRRANATSSNGPSNEASASQPPAMPSSGASAAAPTTDGSTASSPADGGV